MKFGKIIPRSDLKWRHDLEVECFQAQDVKGCQAIGIFDFDGKSAMITHCEKGAFELWREGRSRYDLCSSLRGIELHDNYVSIELQ
jgi:hypothetical protein